MKILSAPGRFLAFGVYNSIFFSCSALLFLWWLLLFIRWIFLHMPCTCELAPTFMFIDYFFPQEIKKSYFLSWVYAFSAGILAESYVMTRLVARSNAAKKKTFLFSSVPLAFIHNLPSAFVILMLMAQKEYVFFYLMGILLSIPMFYTYRPWLTIR